MNVINFIKKYAKNYIFITFGLFLYAFAWSAFLLPAKITGGGVSGIAALIFFATDFPTGISIIIINTILVLAAIKTVDLKFALNSVFGFVVIALFFLLLEGVFTKPLVDDAFMCSLIAAGLSAVATAITFVNGGNTGGVDILALMITKRKNISPGRIILYHDLIVIACSYLIFHSIEKIVYGYVIMGVFSFVLDMVLEGQRQSYQFTIFSKKSEEIASRISHEVGRGVTMIDGHGYYSKEHIQVIIIIARKMDYSPIMKIIDETDSKAFISVAKVAGVFGENFEKIKY
ncbi:MAG: YitT family protein [Bacteroidales bacterium]|nr:YitT family protein [Bacteroidales bacterium]